MQERITCALFALVLMLGGCAPSPFDELTWAKPSPLGRGLESVHPAPSPDDTTEINSLQQPTGSISLRDALAAALLASPDLAAVGYEVRAREAEALQAGRFPNPDLDIELENFGGTGELDGLDTLETTLALSQLIELGGKRLKRQRLANQETRLAAWDYEIRRIDVLSMTAADFVGLLAAQRRLLTATDTLQLAERIFDAINEQVQAGKISPVERSKAHVELAQAKLAHAQATRTVRSARHRLAANWGSSEPLFDTLSGDLDSIAAPPTVESLLSRIESGPDLARWTAQMALRQAEVQLALAQRIPDLTIAGGVRHFEEIDETAFVAGLSFPFPIFDLNQEGVRAARLRALQGGQLEYAARVRARVAVVEAHQSLDAAFISVTTIREQILPNAELAFNAAEEAFRHGKIDALDLLDAERTLFDARRQLTDALISYHTGVIATERLIGAPLNDADLPEGTSP